MERTELTDIEKKVLRAMSKVTFMPASYDKRFYNSLSETGKYTWKQKRYLHFIFNKYRRQISNYQDLAMQLEPDRFNVEVNFTSDLFSPNGKAEVTFKDTFVPKRFVDRTQ